jgi:hypothetical protein
MDIENTDVSAERAELHFLAALVDELMRKLLLSGVMTQADLNAVENAVSRRVGSVSRAW